jgi:hypothetical protein
MGLWGFGDVTLGVAAAVVAVGVPSSSRNAWGRRERE